MPSAKETAGRGQKRARKCYAAVVQMTRVPSRKVRSAEPLARRRNARTLRSRDRDGSLDMNAATIVYEEENRAEQSLTTCRCE